jgi:septum formation protein
MLTLDAPLILASGSPRRRELLAMLNLTFTVLPPTIDEDTIPVDHLPVDARVVELARAKGQSIATTHPHAWVLGADTLVALQDDILGKPKTTQQAEAMLARLQGRAHTVHSGISLHRGGQCWTRHVASQVWFAPMSGSEIRQYVATGEPMDKAGAYGIQGLGSVFIERIDGCYFNVMGLSVRHVYDLLRQPVQTP